MKKIPENKVKLFDVHFWKDNEFDFLLISTKINRQWLTNFVSSEGIILFSKNEKKPQLFVDTRYFEEAKIKVINCDVKEINSFALYWKKIKGKVAIEPELSYGLFDQLRKMNTSINFVSFDLKKLRMLKSDNEIKNLRYICKLTRQIWEKVSFFVQKNSVKTEKEIAHFIVQQFLDNGVKEMAFAPIVSSGPNSAFIHTEPTDYVVKGNLLCDFGGKWKGYCSDFTRTIFFHRSGELYSHWKIIEKVRQNVLAKIKPGVVLKELALTTKKIFSQHNLKLKHALGHGVGLEVHENPLLWERSDIVLQPGMIFTIEPGIYLEKIGGMRHEDVILVTENGYENLTA